MKNARHELSSQRHEKRWICSHLALTQLLWPAVGLRRRTSLPGVHVWRHDENKNVALQHQTTPWTHSSQYTGHACEYTHIDLPASVCVCVVTAGCACHALLLFVSFIIALMSMSQAQDPQMLDQLSKNITRCGLSNSTLNYLRVCGARLLSEEFFFNFFSYTCAVFWQFIFKPNCLLTLPMNSGGFSFTWQQKRQQSVQVVTVKRRR